MSVIFEQLSGRDGLRTSTVRLGGWTVENVLVNVGCTLPSVKPHGLKVAVQEKYVYSQAARSWPCSRLVCRRAALT